MERRDFLKFMGVSTASLAATTALAKLPEVEPKIIRLEPKKIIVPDKMGLVISNATEVFFRLNENGRMVHFKTGEKPRYEPGNRNCDVEVKFETGFDGNVDNGWLAFDSNYTPNNFTFDFNMNGMRMYKDVEQLNGRKFIVNQIDSELIHSNFSTVTIKGFEVFE